MSGDEKSTRHSRRAGSRAGSRARHIPRVLFALVALSTLAPALAEEEAGEYATPWGAHLRELHVETAGLALVALDAPALAAGPCRVLGLAGEPRPQRALDAPAGEVPALVRAIEETPAGYRILLDAGPVPFVHDRLRIRLNDALAAEVVLRAGASPDSLLPLAEGTLFRLGDTGRVQGIAIDYPASEARWVEVLWPRRAGFPEWKGVSLHARDDAAVRIVVPLEAEELEGDAILRAWEAPLPGPSFPLEALRVVAARAGEARILLARRGGFVELAGLRFEREGQLLLKPVGARASTSAAPYARELPSLPSRGVLLRVETTREDPFELGELLAESTPRYLAFDAASAGEHVLACGLPPRDGEREASPPLLADEALAGPLADARLGAEVSPARVLRDEIALSATSPSGRRPAVKRAFVVEAEAAPGESVVAQVPPALDRLLAAPFGQARPESALVAGERTLAAARVARPAPTARRVLEARVYREAGDDATTLRCAAELGEKRPSHAYVELLAPGSALRSAILELVAPPAGALGERRRLTLPAGDVLAAPPSALSPRVAFGDAGMIRLASDVDTLEARLSLERPGDPRGCLFIVDEVDAPIVFRWPEGAEPAPPRLEIYEDPSPLRNSWLSVPYHDEALAARLLAGTTRAGRFVEVRGRGAELDAWLSSPWAIGGALLLAALVLLALVARSLLGGRVGG